MSRRGGVTTDLVRQYLDQAARFSLLDREREADLTKRFRAGLAANQLLRERREELTRRQETTLRRIAAAGTRAKEGMIQANLRLVIPQARRFAGRDLDMIELIQEGNLGLLRAVEKFDHTKGYKFSTYAVWWIRQALQRGVAAHSRTIRLPATTWEVFGRLQTAERELRQELGTDPTETMIAERAGVTVERAREVRDALRPLASLDGPISEDGEVTLGEVIRDVDGEDPTDRVVQDDAVKQVRAALRGLDERERTILILRFGLNGEPPRTLEKIGERLGLTRERIRQVQNRALAKLRHPSRAYRLAGLFDVATRHRLVTEPPQTEHDTGGRSSVPDTD